MRPHLLKTETLAPVIPDRAALHEMACGWAEQQFKLKGEAPAMWLVANGSTVVWIDTPWEDNVEKQASTLLIRMMLEKSKAQAYSFVTEVFVGAFGNLSDEENMRWLAFANKHGVSALPEHLREDGLMIMSHDRDGGLSVSKYLVTLRHGKGPNFLGPRQDETPDGGFAGPMFNLFAPEKDI